MQRFFATTGFALLACLSGQSVHADDTDAPRRLNRRGASRQLKSRASDEVNYDGWKHMKAQISRLEVKPVVVMNFLGSQDFDHAAPLMHATKAPKNFSAFDGGLGLGASIDYRVTNHFLLGTRLDWFSANTNTADSESPAGGSAALSYGLSALPVYLTATYRGQLSERFSLGVSGGPGLATYFHVDQTVTGSSIAGLPNGQKTYTAHPVTFFGMLFCDFDPTDAVSFYFETGYRMISTRHLDSGADVLKDANGQNLNVDLSSVFLGLGATVRL